MKTLDEVIKAFEYTYENDPVAWTYGADALHYLKEYRNTDEYYKKAIAHVTEVIDHYEKMVADYLAVNNPPLTWDELKQMEGKPVWVEYNFCINNKDIRDKSKRWCIVSEFKSWHNTEIIITENGFVLSKNEQNWQAYKKERV